MSLAIWAVMLSLWVVAGEARANLLPNPGFEKAFLFTGLWMALVTGKITPPKAGTGNQKLLDGQGMDCFFSY